MASLARSFGGELNVAGTGYPLLFPTGAVSWNIIHRCSCGFSAVQH